jgi:hypothetical protein
VAFSVAVHPAATTTLYAGIQGGGIQRSTDGGANWTPVNFGLGTPVPRRLVVDPTGATTVFAGVQFGSVWQSSPPVPVELLGFAIE